MSDCSPVSGAAPDPIRHLACQVAQTMGLAVLDVVRHTQRIPISLQVQIRRANGSDVSLDDCARLSGVLGEALEAGDLLNDPYVLEISSPGIGEVLESDRDFHSFRGFPVEVCFTDAAGAAIAREGLLLERDADTVQLNMHGRIQRIPRASVQRVRLTTPRE